MEKKTIELFEMEELEKRFEMGWGGKRDNPGLPDEEPFGLTIR
ncbi:hypothetical protein [uncultured Maribacter sp.]|tara:strand:+ start:22082 stop:22210 length:129 start_codon:yes stop_codon:yes gene_type:complete